MPSLAHFNTHPLHAMFYVTPETPPCHSLPGRRMSVVKGKEENEKAL